MKLLGWGANTYGQLGIGVKSELSAHPVQVTVVPFNLESVRKIMGGGGHTLVLDQLGKVYSCGWNNRGQLGSRERTSEVTFELVESLSAYRVTDICCGWDSSFAVTDSGKLVAWGSNLFGQLGVGKKEVQYTSVPLEVNVRDVLQVSSGLRHTAVVTQSGRLLVSGSGRKGQLGITLENGSPLLECDKFAEVTNIPPVKMAACGQHHTVVLTVPSLIYVWGDNKYGQLGVDPKEMPKVTVPTVVNLELCGQPCKILCGWTHTMIQTVGGVLLCWGRNSYGQLGCLEAEREESWRAGAVRLEGVRQVEAGSEHTVAITVTGELSSWGWNEHGNCGLGTTRDVKKPTNVKVEGDVLLVGTGAAHSFAIVA